MFVLNFIKNTLFFISIDRSLKIYYLYQLLIIKKKVFIYISLNSTLIIAIATLLCIFYILLLSKY
jgi:hypothetical protein